jgi:hypothetical protein
MKKIVLTFGLISGAILSAMMVLMLQFKDAIGFDKGMVVGYTSMVLAGLLIFVGVKTYRDKVGNGVVTFGRALLVGSMISLVATVCYVATWETIYFGGFVPDFAAKYQTAALESAREKGETQAQLDARAAKMAQDFKNYEKPLVNIAFTFLEPLPVGLLLALISAGLLRRRHADRSMLERAPQATSS